MALAEAPMPFRPKNEIAEWRMVYEAFAALNVGDIIKYEELDEILGRDFRADRNPYYRAVRELQVENQRTTAPVRGVGYRIVEAKEHEKLARLHITKGRRQMTKSRRVLESTDKAALDPEARRRIEELQVVVTRHEGLLHQQNLRIKRLEKGLATSSSKGEQTTERLDKLVESLKRHGIDV